MTTNAEIAGATPRTDDFSRVVDLIADINADRFGQPLIAALHLCNDLADALVVKQRELSTARADAERYRWFRSQAWNDSDICAVTIPTKSVRLGYDCPAGSRLDNFIDEAIRRGGEVAK